MKKIGIIGGGFCGTLTAVHLIKNAIDPIEIVIINEEDTLNKGTAFNPYSKQHLLNVTAIKMSAFADYPEHFVDWIMGQDNYIKKDRDTIANSFLPRYPYGEYLVHIWRKTIQSKEAKKIKIKELNALVFRLQFSNNSLTLCLNNNKKYTFDTCIIATGNHIPRNPNIINPYFFKSINYFQNPWNIKAVSHTNSELPILIIGNGLTMVDTVLGLIENGFKNEIYSISPNGFNILPHRPNCFKYSKFTDELSENITLLEIVKLLNKHIKLIRESDLPAEIIIDSLRPQTQKIWQQLTLSEKKKILCEITTFMGSC